LKAYRSSPEDVCLIVYDIISTIFSHIAMKAMSSLIALMGLALGGVCTCLLVMFIRLRWM